MASVPTEKGKTMAEIDKMDFCGELCNFAEELIEKAKPKWIPVTERLPDVECYIYSIDVLFHVPDGNIFVGYVNFETGTWKCLHSRELFAADKVTHWMPMPEPPKE